MTEPFNTVPVLCDIEHAITPGVCVLCERDRAIAYAEDLRRILLTCMSARAIDWRLEAQRDKPAP